MLILENGHLPSNFKLTTKKTYAPDRLTWSQIHDSLLTPSLWFGSIHALVSYGMLDRRIPKQSLTCSTSVRSWFPLLNFVCVILLLGFWSFTILFYQDPCSFFLLVVKVRQLPIIFTSLFNFTFAIFYVCDYVLFRSLLIFLVLKVRQVPNLFTDSWLGVIWLKIKLSSSSKGMIRRKCLY
jgi:hypothetical protein